MKHAGPTTLANLEPLLERLRRLGGPSERKLGTFYIRSSAFLHFHEDPQGVFADVKLDGADFTRLPVNTAAEQDVLVHLATKSLAWISQKRGAKG
jgi:hypothetical protein